MSRADLDAQRASEIRIIVSGRVGSGKSALLGEIEIMLKSIGIPYRYEDEQEADAEKVLTHADWIGELESIKPRVVLVEDKPWLREKAALAAQTPVPAPIEGQSDLSKAVLTAIYRCCQAGASPERLHAAVMALFDAAQAPVQGEPVDHSQRYYIEARKSGFWGWCVKCGNGTRELFVGHKNQCLLVAGKLLEAFEDGQFISTTLQQAPVQGEPWDSFSVEKTGDEHHDSSNFLLNAASAWWNASKRAQVHGAVKWLQGDDGALLIYTRGEYRERLMEAIEAGTGTPVRVFAAIDAARKAGT